LLASSHAATPVSSVEPENGTLASGATNVNTSTASGGGAVKFGAPVTNPNCTVAAGIPSTAANNCNTGYKNAPDYPGSLTTFSGTIQSNHTYNFMKFTGGTFVGSSSTSLTNVTFHGCLFSATGDINVAVFGDNITFDYSTFAPTNEPNPPISYNAGYQYGIEANGAYYAHVNQLTVTNSEFWGFANATDVGGSTQAKPQVFRNNYFHDARADGGVDHTDGIGQLDDGPKSSYVVIDHNTIVSAGNTNGLAYQYGPYDHFSITDNYFSGFGYMLNVGGGNGPSNTTFTGNTWGTNIQQIFGPWYSWSGSGNTWHGNKIHYVNPIKIRGDNANSYIFQPSDDGKFWTPNGISTTDV
jgi:hypothetical protein